ncbi:hypothetical protein F5B21DRAFT_481675 [Xylaria acuta]|nr:hypothetical protein F5B21DRAFT_481675 [Xylaria acuta]
MSPIVAAVLTAALLLTLERVSKWHTVHSLLWATCSRRTDTTRQTRFENLERFYTTNRHNVYVPTSPDIVTFDLRDAEHGTLTIEIPPMSGWYSLTHTHMQSASCSNITTLSGRWFISSAVWVNPGPAPPEKAGVWTSFGKLALDNLTAAAQLNGTVASRVLDHSICSIVQDAEVYFYLCNTPVWIRALYAATAPTPSLREILVYRLLWIQIRATLHVHDFVEDHGTITIFRWINPFAPPAWVHRFEERMRFVKSRFISGMNYWVARNILGMATFYAEYSPEWEPHSKEGFQ